MMISLSDAGKRFNREWVFRHFNYQFETGTHYAITGPNGSGKSTLLQVLGGAMLLSEGKCNWPFETGKEIASENIYRYISLCAPYLELIEEMTLQEFIRFHQKFKPLLPGISIDHILERTGLGPAAEKQIRNYSSGMKQRVKLAQSIFSDTQIVLLDEPCTNLDAAGISLYHSLVNEFCDKRLVIVSSNDEVEYSFCKEKINMADWK
jgi:ABC-type multidrug transport system ATPase subunit